MINKFMEWMVWHPPVFAAFTFILLLMATFAGGFIGHKAFDWIDRIFANNRIM